eukprot:gene5891-7093_t
MDVLTESVSQHSIRLGRAVDLVLGADKKGFQRASLAFDRHQQDSLLPALQALKEEATSRQLEVAGFDPLFSPLLEQVSRNKSCSQQRQIFRVVSWLLRHGDAAVVVNRIAGFLEHPDKRLQLSAALSLRSLIDEITLSGNEALLDILQKHFFEWTERLMEIIAPSNQGNSAQGSKALPTRIATTAAETVLAMTTCLTSPVTSIRQSVASAEGAGVSDVYVKAATWLSACWAHYGDLVRQQPADGSSGKSGELAAQWMGVLASSEATVNSGERSIEEVQGLRLHALTCLCLIIGQRDPTGKSSMLANAANGQAGPLMSALLGDHVDTQDLAAALLRHLLLPQVLPLSAFDNLEDQDLYATAAAAAPCSERTKTCCDESGPPASNDNRAEAVAAGGHRDGAGPGEEALGEPPGIALQLALRMVSGEDADEVRRLSGRGCDVRCVGKEQGW